jgi:hypothetical protein
MTHKMKRRTTLKNVSMFVTAFFVPIFTTITYSPSLLLVHLFLFALLVGFTYHAVHKINHPQLNLWLSHPTKSRDMLYNSLIEYSKLIIILVPCFYLSLYLLGDEQNELNKASQFQLIWHLTQQAWCLWLITNCFCIYRKSGHSQ